MTISEDDNHQSME